MSLDDDMRVLSRVNLFKGFSREQLRLMAFGAENVSLHAERILYAEGTPADCAFIVASGEIELYRSEAGKRRVLDTMGPNSILGELALIADGERLTSAAARTDAELIRLNRTMFRRILEEYPRTATELQERITENLQTLISDLATAAARLGE